MGVETKFNKLGVDTRPEKVADDKYPTEPNPTTVDVKLAWDKVPLPKGPRAVENDDKDPARVEVRVGLET